MYKKTLKILAFSLICLNLSGCVDVATSIHSLRTNLFGENNNEKQLKALSKDYVIYFFHNGDLYCNNMATYLKGFSEIYHWKVCEITPEGVKKTGQFTWTSEDRQLFKTFNIVKFPTAFAVHQKANVAFRVIYLDEYENMHKTIIDFTDALDPYMLQRRIDSKTPLSMKIVDESLLEMNQKKYRKFVI